MEGVGTEPQDRVDSYFGEQASYWRDVYADHEVQGLVYRERMQAALAWIDDLRLAPGARVLEVGCGSGLATLELARRGLRVESTDSTADMVDLAGRRTEETGVADRVELRVADVHSLPYPDGTFELVLALGVLPWLHTPQRAIGELGRVLAPGGRALLTADNRLRLNMLTEPAESPLVVPFKYALRAARRVRGSRPRGAVSRLYTPRAVDRMLVAAGLEPERRATLGFGPFTFRWRAVLAGRLGIRLHRALGQLAAERVPRLRLTGWHYLVQARRARS